MTATGVPAMRPITSRPAWPMAVERGKCGNFAVGNAEGVGQIVGKVAQPGAEHQRDLRAQSGFRADELRRRFGAGEFI